MEAEFKLWLDQLWLRHTAELTFSEIRKAVQALSRGYVQNRTSHLGSALASAGKRAGFALYYGPLHFLLVGGICRELGSGSGRLDQIVDLGCGTGVGGAAWSLTASQRPALLGIDGNPWAVEEAVWTYRTMKLRGRTRCEDLGRTRLSGPRTGILLAFTVNEIGPDERAILKAKLLDRAERGAQVLVVEPIARRITPWWDEWSSDFVRAGGRADHWRFPATLPESLRLMDKAAGLDHRELTGRSLWLPSSG